MADLRSNEDGYKSELWKGLIQPDGSITRESLDKAQNHDNPDVRALAVYLAGPGSEGNSVIEDIMKKKDGSGFAWEIFKTWYDE